MLKFVCGTCRHLLGTAEKNIGRSIRCPHCGHPALVAPLLVDAPRWEASTVPSSQVVEEASSELLAASSPPASSAIAQLSAKANWDAKLPVLRRTPGPLFRYCVLGIDKAVQMQVQWTINAENEEGARWKAERGGMEVQSIKSHGPSTPEKDPLENPRGRRRGRRFF